MKNILIIQPAFLGDVILATALAENIHANHPGYEISLLVRKGNESLLKNHPFLKEVLVWDKTTSKFSNLFKLIRQIRKNRYEIVINLHRFATSGLITAFSGAAITTGYNKNPVSFLFAKKVNHVIGDGRHEIDRYLSLTDFFCDRKISKPVLYPNADDDASTLKYKGTPYVVMAPASVWFTKKLPDEKWIELVKMIPAGLKIFFIGAPGDHSLCQELIDKSGSTSAENLAGKLSLLQSVSLIRDAGMNYVNDSAPLHMASSVNAPVTAFFCSTIPQFGFGPLSDHSKIVETTEILDCRPCGLHGKSKCPLGHFKCGHSIKIEPTLIPSF